MAEGKSVGYKKWATNDEAGLQKLPKVKELDAEFSELLTKKKAAYPDYRKARNEMQELVRAQKKCRTLFCRGKEHHRENTDPINEYRRGAFPVGRHPRRIF